MRTFLASILSFFLTLNALSQISTCDGTAVTTSSTINGKSSLSKVNGFTLGSGASNLTVQYWQNMEGAATAAGWAANDHTGGGWTYGGFSGGFISSTSHQMSMISTVNTITDSGTHSIEWQAGVNDVISITPPTTLSGPITGSFFLFWPGCTGQYTVQVLGFNYHDRELKIVTQFGGGSAAIGWSTGGATPSVTLPPSTPGIYYVEYQVGGTGANSDNVYVYNGSGFTTPVGSQSVNPGALSCSIIFFGDVDSQDPTDNLYFDNLIFQTTSAATPPGFGP